MYEFASFLFLIVLSSSECKTEIGDYIVDCSACQFAPLVEVKSYSCKVRCEAEGEASTNLTTLYNLLLRLSAELEETKRELNATREILKIDISFSAKLEGRISYNGGDKIVFPNVFTNVGDAYDSITGIFTAPHNGTYQFMVFSVGTTGTQFAWLTINGERLALSHGRVSWSQGGTAVNKKLVVGDQAWVESGQSDTFEGEYSIFTGNIIRVDF